MSNDKRYYTPSVKIGFILSAFLLFLILLFPFENPFTGSLLHYAVTGLLLINNMVSLCFYGAHLKERKDKKQSVGWLWFAALLGFSMGVILCWVTHPIALYGILLVLFTSGSFLSFACRMDWKKKNQHEKKAAWITFFVSVSIIAVSLFLWGAWHFQGGLQLLQNLSFIMTDSQWGVLAVFAAIQVFVGFAQYAAKAVSYFGKQVKQDKRYWEYGLCVLSFIPGLILSALLIVSPLYPVSGGIESHLILSLMVCSACTSLGSKIGRSIDESKKISAPAQNLLHAWTSHPLWIYGIRPLLTGVAFLTLGFALLGSSAGFGLADSSGFLLLPWVLDSTHFSLSLAALSVILIANLIFYWFKPRVTPIPTYQIILESAKVQTLLEELKKSQAPITLGNKDQIFVFEYINKLIFRGSGFIWNEGIAVENTVLRGIQARLPNINETDKNKLLQIAQAIKINPSYRPFSNTRFRIALWILGSAVLLIGSLSLLILMLTGLISLANAIWIMALAGLLGFGAFSSIRYALNHYKGGAYATWSVVWGTLALTAAALSILVRYTPVYFPVSIAATCVFGLFFFLFARAARQPEADQEWATRSLLVFKLSLGVACLITACLSLVTLFNLGGIGVDIGIQMIHALSDQFIVGKGWFTLFCVSAFVVSVWGAFELFSSSLEISPKTVSELREREKYLSLGAWSLKLLFFIVILILTAMPSIFPMGSHVALLPVFLIMSTVMPLFSGKLHLPWPFQEWGKRINEIVWVTQDKNAQTIVMRESLVFASLVSIPAVVAYCCSVSVELALPICSIGVAFTLILRWGAMGSNVVKNKMETSAVVPPYTPDWRSPSSEIVTRGVQQPSHSHMPHTPVCLVM